MFDPYDVMYVDKRAIPKSGYEFDTNKMTSQSAGRLRRMKEPLKGAHQEVTSGKTRSLADWYKDITREEILGLDKFDIATVGMSKPEESYWKAWDELKKDPVFAKLDKDKKLELSKSLKAAFGWHGNEPSDPLDDLIKFDKDFDKLFKE
jgi:hypothetical protein